MYSGFTVLERFGPSSEGWLKYLEFSKLTHLVEVVSLDALLCPCVVHDLRDEVWSHFVPEIVSVSAFDDVAWLVMRHPVQPGEQLLKVVQDPDRDVGAVELGRGWAFAGYDLIEHDGNISALTNCGGFDGAFTAADLNERGLITKYEDAKRIHEALRVRYPEEPHANCVLVAIWRGLT